MRKRRIVSGVGLFLAGAATVVAVAVIYVVRQARGCEARQVAWLTAQQEVLDAAEDVRYWEEAAGLERIPLWEWGSEADPLKGQWLEWSEADGLDQLLVEGVDGTTDMLFSARGRVDSISDLIGELHDRVREVCEPHEIRYE